MIMINILLLKNLISQHQEMLLQDSNKQIKQAKSFIKKTDFNNKLKNVSSNKNELNELLKIVKAI